MRLRALFLVCIAARFAPAQAIPCHSLAADQITGKDLAAAIPAFQALPPDTLLAPLPPPGMRRTFHAPELQNIARRYAIPVENPADACFEWAAAPLDRDRVTEAMRQSLEVADARIEIVEMSLAPVPAGRLEFPRERLGSPAVRDGRTPVLWRGDAVYGENHRLAVWAKVRLTVPCVRIVAAENLKPGLPVEPRQVRSTEAECFPSARTKLSLDQVVGTTLRHPVGAGATILPEFLDGIKEVNRGDSVAVEVFSGAAHLQFVALAESAGSNGEMIALRNPSSKHLFRARVIGRGKAVVQALSSLESSLEAIQ